MDWTQALTVIGIFIGGFLYMMNRMDSKLDHLGDRIGKVENRLTSLEAEAKNTSQRITDLKTDMNQRFSNIENCIIPRKVFRFEESHRDDREEPKEN
jgi:predicted nuclease with TOPRIM domain